MILCKTYFFFHLFVALSAICNFTKNLIFLSPELRYTFSFLGTLPFGWSFLGLTYLSYFFCDQIAHCQHPKTSLPLECFKKRYKNRTFKILFFVIWSQLWKRRKKDERGAKERLQFFANSVSGSLWPEFKRLSKYFSPSKKLL